MQRVRACVCAGTGNNKVGPWKKVQGPGRTGARYKAHTVCTNSWYKRTVAAWGPGKARSPGGKGHGWVRQGKGLAHGTGRKGP